MHPHAGSLAALRHRLYLVDGRAPVSVLLQAMRVLHVSTPTLHLYASDGHPLRLGQPLSSLAPAAGAVRVLCSALAPGMLAGTAARANPVGGAGVIRDYLEDVGRAAWRVALCPAAQALPDYGVRVQASGRRKRRPREGREGRARALAARGRRAIAK